MRVVLAIDGSEGARWARDMLLALPLSQAADVTVVTVTDVPHPRFTSLTPMARRAYNVALATLQREAEEAAREVLDAARGALEGRVASMTTRVEQGRAAAAIVEAAEVWAADLVVVGSRGLGPVKEFLLGSVSQKVARYAPCSVLVVKFPAGMVRRVLLALDGSPHAEAGVKFLAELSLLSDTALHVCAVVEVPVFVPADAGRSREGRDGVLRTIAEVEREAAEHVLAEARTVLATSGYMVTTSLRFGNVADELLIVVQEFRPDLVVIGAKGRTATKRFVLGSVAQKILKSARCSVVVVRP